MECYVVTVEQGYAHNWAVLGATATLDDAKALARYTDWIERPYDEWVCRVPAFGSRTDTMAGDYHIYRFDLNGQ